jgi:hypothetical protein
MRIWRIKIGIVLVLQCIYIATCIAGTQPGAYYSTFMIKRDTPLYLHSVLFRTIYYYQVVFRVMKPWTRTTRPSLLWRPTIWRHNIRGRLDVPWIALLRHAGSVNALPLIATHQ